MSQNIYDDPDFFAGYMTLDRQVRGHDGAAEWPSIRAMLPDLRGARAVDLGCGAGWFTRFAAEQGAAQVVGIDVSTNMLERARSETTSSVVDYQRCDLDELSLDSRSLDLAYSSLTLHYVCDLDRLLAAIADALVVGGALVFSVEHPIYSAPTAQSFVTADDGSRYWPLDNYLVEGERVTEWFVDGVKKQHRTIATYVNSVVAAGFVVDELIEWGPTAEDVMAAPALADDRHRPWFLLVRATRVD